MGIHWRPECHLVAVVHAILWMLRRCVRVRARTLSCIDRSCLCSFHAIALSIAKRAARRHRSLAAIAHSPPSLTRCHRSLAAIAHSPP